MNKILDNGEYVAPEINVIQIKSQGILCQSPMGSSEGYGEGGERSW